MVYEFKFIFDESKVFDSGMDIDHNMFLAKTIIHNLYDTFRLRYVNNNDYFITMNDILEVLGFDRELKYIKYYYLYPNDFDILVRKNKHNEIEIIIDGLREA